jgi:sugar lactone lactonase YvrE
MKATIKVWCLLSLLTLILVGIAPASAQANHQPSINNFQAADVAMGQPGLNFHYVSTIGLTSQPYQGDVLHLNKPEGMSIDSADNLFVVEVIGQRILGYNASGSNVLSIGHAGDGQHFGSYVSTPHDVTTDSSGNLWVVMDHAVKAFNPAGDQLMIMPENEPWKSGSDNTHFNMPTGIAFDQNGLLFVSDFVNHRVQVYNVSGTALTYVNTIGATGESGSDDQHFNLPGRIVFDSSNAAYIVDAGNYRVQKCTTTDSWASWECDKFFGGIQGSDPAAGQMGFAFGIGVDHANNNIYIADGTNDRVLKCTPAGACAHFVGTVGAPGNDNSHFSWVSDVKVDSTGQVYVSDEDNMRIQVFTSAGVYVKTIGQTGVPYQGDAYRYFEPFGLAPAKDGGLYIAENHGYRLIKVDATGSQVWTAGHAGMFGSGNDYFGNSGEGLDANPVEAQDGSKVYIPDPGNNRIQILDAVSGAYQSTFGAYGLGEYQFSSPSGISINPLNQDFLVADRSNHRVQVFNSAWVYKTTIGISGVSGDDNNHFNMPRGVAVNNSGAVFVADFGNLRVQKCTTANGTTYTCSTFAGVTHQSGGDFGHVQANNVAVDNSGRVYVVDVSNERVLVYDPNGAYLSTFGGSRSTSNGSLYLPYGVTVEKSGYVYIADTSNFRVQKFFPGVLGWRQVNSDGFGDRNNLLDAMETFNGKIYAASSNWSGPGGSVYSSSNGRDWTPASAGGFGAGNSVPAILDLQVFNGQLYASTGWGSQGNNSVRIYRTLNGINWNPVVSDGFGNANNSAVIAMTAYNTKLYAAVSNYGDGAEIWSSSTGNENSWAPVMTGGFGDADNKTINTFAVFQGVLYASAYHSSSGAGIWRWTNDTTWEKVKSFGYTSSDIAEAVICVFNDQLYAGVRNESGGAELHRTGNGTTWNKVMDGGFNIPANFEIQNLVVYNNQLYAETGNKVAGLEVWYSGDGSAWTKANISGFGNSNNSGSLWNNAGFTVFNDALYLATWNSASGGEVWELQKTIFLPVTSKP